MTIKTAALKRGNDRFAVFVAGEMAVKTDYDILFALNVFKKSEINEEEFLSLKSEIEIYEAKKRAFILLGMRAHSKSELISKLRQKGFSKPSALAAAGYLDQNGYLDDESFAREFYKSLSNKGYAGQKIRYALSQKGISRDVIDEIMSQEDVCGQNDVAILSLIEKKTKGEKITKESRGKIYAFLARRGFKSDDILRGMQQFMDDFEDESLA